MKRARWAGRLLLLGLLALGAFNLAFVVRNWQQVQQVTTPRGSSAPEVELPLLQGGMLRLSAERGHPVVLAFWASWCDPCMHELPGVDRVAHRFADRARFVAVNTEGDRAAAAAAVAKLGLTLPVALDDGAAGAAYRVTTIPHLVIVDSAGQVAQVLRGVHGEDEIADAVAALLR